MKTNRRGRFLLGGLGLLLPTALWLGGFFASGTWSLIDVASLPGDCPFFSAVFPLFVVLFAALSGYFAGKKDSPVYFKAAMTGLFLPVVSYPVSALLFSLFQWLEWRLPMLLVLYTVGMLGSLFTSAALGLQEVLERSVLGDWIHASLFYEAGFLVLALALLLALVVGILLFRRGKQARISEEEDSERRR